MERDIRQTNRQGTVGGEGAVGDVRGGGSDSPRESEPAAWTDMRGAGSGRGRDGRNGFIGREGQTKESSAGRWRR
jgi:hypothetical protein